MWNPKLIVVTGSSGKTTLLHMIESQLGNRAKYSWHANSSFGIPFDILGMERKKLTFFEWPFLFLKAPLALFGSLPAEKIYIAEADCDRPFEGEFLGSLLKPDITLWLNVTKTHSMNFEEKAAVEGIDLVQAITNEYGRLVRYTKKLLIYNKDQSNLDKFVQGLKISCKAVSVKNLELSYKINSGKTQFVIDGTYFEFKYLLPKASVYQILMCLKLLEELELEFKNFSKFRIPPGRSSLFKGIKNTTLIDSTYNANLDSMTAILHMFDSYPASEKWIVLGDMLEQGKNEKAEHEKLADEISRYKFSKIILMGPRVSAYTKPALKKESISFTRPDDVANYLKNNIKGGEAILFKGARFLEGVIEVLLLNKSDSVLLSRREKIWQKRRKKFGL